MAGGMSGLLLVDKPEGWTSHDVVGKVRRLSGVRRVGHAGTLDPMATGLLIVLIGRATRAAEFAESGFKSYNAALRLGVRTDTLDTTGTVLDRQDAVPDIEAVRAALPCFTGEIEQIPPMYSAIKKDGRKLYEIARAGGEVEREARSVTISRLECTGVDTNGDFLLEVDCSKGTYIRSLCADIGEYLGCGGCMSALRRVAIEPFSVRDAHSIDEIERLGVANLLLPTDSLFDKYPKLTLTRERDVSAVKNGNEISLDENCEGKLRVYSQGGEFLMLGEARQGVLRTIKSFFEV